MFMALDEHMSTLRRRAMSAFPNGHSRRFSIVPNGDMALLRRANFILNRETINMARLTAGLRVLW